MKLFHFAPALVCLFLCTLLNGQSQTELANAESVDSEQNLTAEEMYNQARGFDNQKDYTEAVKWYRKAAEKGYAAAQTSLGWCYESGNGVQQDYAEAAKWYRKAAEQGNVTAQNNLGYCYESGHGVQQDYAEAAKWYRKAAEQGNVTAQTNLGWCYESGQGVQKSSTEAVKWYQKAAEQGFARAQTNLGYCYENGLGVQQDYAEAVKWYQKAAEQGFARAQNNLGVCYNLGRGVQQDYAEAEKWYRKAAGQGYTSAKNNLDILLAKAPGDIIAKEILAQKTAQPKAVDLGLSVKWASCNVGATSPEDYGGYYAWGETSTKNDYDWSTLKYCTDTSGDHFSKYVSSGNAEYWSGEGMPDNRTKLMLSDDAARANWGGSWRMPTEAEWTELRTKCKWTWTSQGGKNGYKVTGPNGNSIFLPAADFRNGTFLGSAGSDGFYWSSSLYTDFPYNARLVYFYSGGVTSDSIYRYLGLSVRPVSE